MHYVFKEGVRIDNVIRKIQIKYGIDLTPYIVDRELLINGVTLRLFDELEALHLVELKG